MKVCEGSKKVKKNNYKRGDVLKFFNANSKYDYYLVVQNPNPRGGDYMLVSLKDGSIWNSDSVTMYGSREPKDFVRVDACLTINHD